MKYARGMANLRDLIQEQVRVHVGCGRVILPGFINADLRNQHAHVRFDAAEPWPCDDACVDFIFSEDFIEHLDQHAQVRFLAETWRVLKPGGRQHISTPDLAWIMEARSTFQLGAKGVYDEWGKWGHEVVHTAQSLQLLCEMVGFSVLPSVRQDYATRPGGDRDPLGNVYLDLLKPER